MSVQTREKIHLGEGTHIPLELPRLSYPAQRRALRMALILGDGLMLTVALLLASWLRFELQVGLAADAASQPQFYTKLMVALLAIWLALFGVFRLYDFRHLLGGIEEYARIFDAASVGVLVVVVVTFLAPSLVISRGWLTFAWLLAIFLVAAERFSIRRIVYWLRRKGYFVVPAVIVGINDEAIALAEQLASWKTSGLLVLGFVDNGSSEEIHRPMRLPVLGGLSSLPDLVQRQGVQELVIATSAVRSDHLLDLFRRYGVSENINLRLSSGLFDVFTTGLHVKELGYVPLITVSKVRLTPFESFLKNCLDLFGAAFAMIVLFPLFAAISIAIRLDSPGPIIYRRRVLGCGGKVFDAYKFRSMYADGDEMLSPEQWAELQTHHKLKEDPRITRVGRFLRKYSLDELPQMANVLKGQMSLIGPRMITPAEQEKYGKWDMNLLTVKPGLSGLWQVSGRSDIGYEERVAIDMQYIRNYSIWFDIQLILRTIVTVISGKGAY